MPWEWIVLGLRSPWVGVWPTLQCQRSQNTVLRLQVTYEETTDPRSASDWEAKCQRAIGRKGDCISTVSPPAFHFKGWFWVQKALDKWVMDWTKFPLVFNSLWLHLSKSGVSSGARWPQRMAPDRKFVSTETLWEEVCWAWGKGLASCSLALMTTELSP